MSTLVMQLADGDGRTVWKGRSRYGVEYVDAVDAFPAATYAPEQAAPLDIEVTHGGPVIGTITYLERGLASPDLVAVGLVDLDPEHFDGVYASAEADTRNRGSLKLKAVAIVDATARVGGRPISAWPFDYRYDGMAASEPEILKRARAASVECRSRWDPLRVHEPERRELDPRSALGRSAGRHVLVNGEALEVEIRDTGRILSVR